MLLSRSNLLKHNNMDYKNENSNKSPSGNSDNYETYQLDQEIEDVKSKLLECHMHCENTAMEIYRISELKDKGTFVLTNVARQYKDLDEELNEIHCNYMKCIAKVDSYEEYVNQKVDSLTLQRDNLKKELSVLKKNADANDKKLIEIKKMITIQENKNMALIRKLKRLLKNMHISPHMQEQVNEILNDPRASNTNISK